MSILQRLGAKSVATVPHGGSPRGSGFCACLAVAAAVSLMSGAASAQSADEKDSNIEVAQQVIKNALTLNAISSEMRLIGWTGTLLGIAVNPLDIVAEVTVGGAVGAATGKYRLGKLAGENASSLILASALGPIGAGVLLVRAGNKTVTYIQEENKATYKKTLAETIERISATRQSETGAMRLAERLAQNDWSPERKSAHEHHISGLIKDSAKSGFIHESLEVYAQTESTYAAAGGQPSAWLADYSTLNHAHAEYSDTETTSEPLLVAATHINASSADHGIALASRLNQSPSEMLSFFSSQVTPESAQSYLDENTEPAPTQGSSRGMRF